MDKCGKLVVTMGMLSLLSVMPLAAQVDNGIVFTAPFPFYAGNVKWPTGSYIITEPDANDKIALIRNIARTKGEFINFIPMTSLNPPPVAGHYIENTGNTELIFLEMFKADQYMDFSMNNWIRHLPPEMVTAHLNIEEVTIKKIPVENQAVIAG
jgi:hypothetical protein